MKQIRQVLAAGCVLLCLAACAPQTEERTAYGRYLEESLPLPAELTALWEISMTGEAQFLILGEAGDETLHTWISQDGGESWEMRDFPWLEALQDYDMNAFALDESGTPWFAHAPEDPEGEAVYASGDADAIAAHTPLPDVLCSIRNDRPMEHKALLQSSGGISVQNFVLWGDYAAVSHSSLAVYRLSSGERLMELEEEAFYQPGEYCLLEDTLAVLEDGGISLYSLGEGRSLRQLEIQGNNYPGGKTDFFDFSSRQAVLAPTPDPGVLAYCSGGGIYRISNDGLLHERILSGDTTSLIQPNLSLERLFVSEDTYYVYVTGRDSLPWSLSGARLLRYRYDESAPALPTTMLRVYSVTDSPTVRQTAALFQQSQPAIQVRLETALSQPAGAATGDALRTLSTELLAGRGPDLLILDNLPMESYHKKGALLDLSEVLSPEMPDQLLPCLLAGQDAFYAIPTRFTMPMILTDPDTLEAVSSLDGLTQHLTELESPQTGVLPADYFELIQSVYGAEWYLDDGALDEKAVSLALEDLSRLIRCYDGTDPQQLWNAEGDARVGAIGLIGGWIPLFIHHLASLDQLAGPYTAVRDYGAVYEPYPSGAELHPKVIAGITSSSAQPQLAAEFIELMLSEQVQTEKLGDGMPVNRSALRASAQNPTAEEASRYGVSFRDEFEGWRDKGLTLPLYWPDDAYLESFLQQIEGAEVRWPGDSTAQGILQEEAQEYLAGKRPLDETVQSIRQKLELYQNEA